MRSYIVSGHFYSSVLLYEMSSVPPFAVKYIPGESVGYFPGYCDVSVTAAVPAFSGGLLILV